MADCLAEMPEVTVWVGDTAIVLNTLNVHYIITQATPNQQLKEQVSAFDTDWMDEEFVCEISLTADDLKSFTQFWKKASNNFIGL